MARVLIVGIGNPLRSDDGVGWHVAQELRRDLPDSDVQVIVAQQLTPEIADFVCHAQRVLFVDATQGRQPGSVRCEQVVPAESLGRHSHQMSPAVILKMAEQLYGCCPPAYLLTVAGEIFADGDGISQNVMAALPKVRERIRRFVEGLELETQ